MIRAVWLSSDGLPTGELPGLAAQQRRMNVYDDLGGDTELCRRGEHPDLDDRGYCLACGATPIRTESHERRSKRTYVRGKRSDLDKAP